LIAPEMARRLTNELHRHVTLEDLALRLVPNEEHGYLSLESEQMFLENALSDVALRTAEEMQLVVSPVLVSLVNEIWKPDSPEKYSMYSVVAGVDPVQGPPFGPFESAGEGSDSSLRTSGSAGRTTTPSPC
jgi:putative ABC transport system permease protein